MRNPKHPRKAPRAAGPRDRPGARAGAPRRDGPGKPWLWTCREGFERVLAQELELEGVGARVLEPGVVESQGVPATLPAFARMAFEIQGRVRLAEVSLPQFSTLWPEAVYVQGWVPDTAAGNLASGRVRELQEQVLASRRAAGLTTLASAPEAQARGAVLAQLALCADGTLVYGKVPAVDAMSVAPGGRTRVKRPLGSPSRAAMKLEEALATLANEPGRGEVCVDLGAAPGGWTERLLARGAQVVAVDPANLSEDLRGHRGLRHVKDSAFRFRPEHPVDWLLCDMAWRPLEVVQLLARWGQRRWARQLVANIKLPMKDKVPVVSRVRAELSGAGWRAMTVRQLYHDRDEVTVTAIAW